MKQSLSPAYIPLYQKPYCCAVTCLQMVIYRNDDVLVCQESLAEILGVRATKEDQGVFSFPIKLLSEVGYDEGVTTIDLASDINDYLTCQKSRVLATSYPASSIDDLKILIISHIDQNHDIQIEHYTHHIYPDNNGIHDCLIESYDDDGVIFVDPWARRQSRYFVSWNQLENSLDISNGRECGLLIYQALDD